MSKIKYGLILASFFASPIQLAFAGPSADGPAGFTTTWHGHGSNHQGNNNAGDTAADRHNFDGATAGNSGKNPRAKANGG